MHATKQEGIDEAANARCEHQPVASGPHIGGQVPGDCRVIDRCAVDGDIKAYRRDAICRARSLHPGKVVRHQADDHDGEDASKDVGGDKKRLGF